MKTIEVAQVSAFTSSSGGGNSAGVVWPASDLNAVERQKLAADLGFSETAFVDRNQNGDLTLEYFTPNRQIEICGHATVAAFSFLRDQGAVKLGSHSFSTLIGTQQVEVRENEVGLWQRRLSYAELTNEELLKQVCLSLGLSQDEIRGPLRQASNGSAFVLVEVKSLEALRSLTPDQAEILKVSELLNLVGYYVYYRREDSDVEVRMFAPRYGIPEESATGMAAGALALALNTQSKIEILRVHQGNAMNPPSPSLLTVKLFPDNKALVQGEAMLLTSFQRTIE